MFLSPAWSQSTMNYLPLEMTEIIHLWPKDFTQLKYSHSRIFWEFLRNVIEEWINESFTKVSWIHLPDASIHSPRFIESFTSVPSNPSLMFPQIIHWLFLDSFTDTLIHLPTFHWSIHLCFIESFTNISSNHSPTFHRIIHQHFIESFTSISSNHSPALHQIIHQRLFKSFTNVFHWIIHQHFMNSFTDDYYSFTYELESDLDTSTTLK